MEIFTSSKINLNSSKPTFGLRVCVPIHPSVENARIFKNTTSANLRIVPSVIRDGEDVLSTDVKPGPGKGQFAGEFRRQGIANLKAL